MKQSGTDNEPVDEYGPSNPDTEYRTLGELNHQ